MTLPRPAVPAAVYVAAVVATGDDAGLLSWSDEEADARALYEEAVADGTVSVRFVRVEIPANVRAEMRALARHGETVADLVTSYVDWHGCHCVDWSPAPDAVLLVEHRAGWSA